MPNYDITHKGLTQEEVSLLLQQHGQNKLPEKAPPSNVQLLLEQLKSPLVYILLVAAIVTLFLHEYSDAIIIFASVTINTILGFVQEKRAGESLEALKKLLHPMAHVIRNGERQEVPIEELVPGDLVVLNAGDKIPGDGEVIEANRLFIDEAILTGESVPVEKHQNEKISMGTVVAAGQGLMQVKQTGADTEIGKIALDVQNDDEVSPLTKQLVAFSKQLTILVSIITVFVFVVGVIFGKDLIEIFTTSVALAVSSIPEGLLVALTVVLALGMQRILKRKGLVRNLVSAETLGGVTVICTDKTGTLTEGKMQVVDVIGDEDTLRLQTVLANDMDDPMVIASGAWGSEKFPDTNAILNKHGRIDSIPFSSEERFFASLNKFDEESHLLFVNGAPEFLLDWAINISEDEKNQLKGKIYDLSAKGYRIIGYAQKRYSKSKTSLELSDPKSDLHWVGLLAFSDPIRSDVKVALEQTQSAGIKMVVITGDYAQTAVSVMHQLGLEVRKESVILGDQIESMSDAELANWLKENDTTKLFARTKPHHKSKIVNALKANGEVVAMMGDGVNDAPALKKSDIGIVVGEATDVAKETADLVLLDSSFATIVAAIEEGRGIFDNIRKIILYLMCDAFGEILVIVLGLLFQVPLPVTASQILWINIVSDGFPSLALTIDPKSKQIMKRPPRSPKTPIVTGWMKLLMGTVSAIAGLMAFGLFYYMLRTTGDTVLAQSVAFAALGVNSLVYVFSIRTLREPFWEENPFSNRLLVVAVIAGFALQYLPYAFEITRRFFEIKPIGNMWWYVLGVSILMFVTVEIFKHFFKKQMEN